MWRSLFSIWCTIWMVMAIRDVGTITKCSGNPLPGLFVIAVALMLLTTSALAVLAYNEYIESD